MEHNVSNPGILGLLGFGTTTFLLNLHNVGLLPLSIVIVAMGIFMGGLAQIIAGVFEMKHGSTFGGTAFISYGLFWWSLVMIWLSPFGSLEAATSASVGWYLLLWGIYTTAMFICTLKHNRISQLVFGSLAVLFYLLAAENFTGSEAVAMAAGVVGIVCGLLAIYSALGQIINNEYGKDILPL